MNLTRLPKTAPSDNVRQQQDEFEQFLALSGLELNGSLGLVIPRRYTKDGSETHTVQLGAFWMPPTAISSRPTPLTRVADAMWCVALCAGVAFQTTRDTKSSYSIAAITASQLSKLIEYSRLNGLDTPWKWKQADFDVLARELADAGWAGALKLRDRTDALLRDRPELICELLDRRSQKQRPSLREARFRAALGTNLRGKELKQARQLLLAAADGATQDLGSTLVGMSLSMLRQVMDAINTLHELPQQLRLAYVPFPNSAFLATRLGRPLKKTKNLSAAEAAALLCEGVHWIYDVGPCVVELLKQLAELQRLAIDEGAEKLGETFLEHIRKSSAALLIEAAAQRQIRSLHSRRSPDGEVSLYEIILMLQSAIWIVIAGMNARRRDEICHPRIGLQAGCIRVVDEELGLFIGSFFIEKTLNDYLDFYVNRVTYDAVMLLEDLAAAFCTCDGAKEISKVGPLFTIRKISALRGVGSEPIWPRLEAHTDNGPNPFINFVLGGALDVRPHMFRRFYALVFYYQHEIPSLTALSQQLAHLDLASTQHYVTDGPNLRDDERIAAKLQVNERARRAYRRERYSMDKELELVSDEKLVEAVLAILAETPVSGGYPKFIRRFYRKIEPFLEAPSSEPLRRAEQLASHLKRKGHRPQPFRHGQCMAGPFLSTRSARCRGSGGQLEKHRANGVTCAPCPFHYVNSAYVSNLRADLDELRDSAQQLAGSVEGESLRRQANNLQSVIVLHERRLAS
jgi:hypothetical protein